MVIGAVAAGLCYNSTQLKNANGEAFLKIQEKIDVFIQVIMTATFITICWWI